MQSTVVQPETAPRLNHKPPTLIWYLCCPICRRRYPSSLALRKWRADYSLIDYPIQKGVSLGCRGFSVTDYVNWYSVKGIPSEVHETLLIFLRRVENTYRFIEELRLLTVDDYVQAYEAEDDFAVAYGLRGVHEG